jgi:hypothetical protein
MQGFLWRQRVDGAVSEQLTDSDGTDHQPDWSPDGGRVVFVRYDGRAMELMLLEIGTGAVTALTSGGAVNVEPRWSPDGTRLAWVSTAGTGHFLLHTAVVRPTCRRLPAGADRRSAVPRWYYSPLITRSIRPDAGRSRWYRLGSGGRARHWGHRAHGRDGSGSMEVLRREETNWVVRPEVRPTGRACLPSYLAGSGTSSLLPPGGGSGAYPLPLTYGDFDNTAPLVPGWARIYLESTGNVALARRRSRASRRRSARAPLARAAAAADGQVKDERAVRRRRACR